MTYPRRVAGDTNPDREATRLHVLDELRAHDAPLVEYVTAGGLRGFTTDEMFPQETK